MEYIYLRLNSMYVNRKDKDVLPWIQLFLFKVHL
jgi:hypothetical protein